MHFAQVLVKFVQNTSIQINMCFRSCFCLDNTDSEKEVQCKMEHSDCVAVPPALKKSAAMQVAFKKLTQCMLHTSVVVLLL